MTTTQLNTLTSVVTVPGGWTSRPFQGPADFDRMVKVVYASQTADGLEQGHTAEQLAAFYSTFKNFDLSADLVLVERDGELGAYAGTRWWQEQNGTFLHVLWLTVAPEARGQGLEPQLLRFVQERARLAAAAHPEGPAFLNSFIGESQGWLSDLLTDAGYAPVRYFYEMIRPNLNDLPAAELPPGLEVRPVTPDHYHKIWRANTEAFADHWGEQVQDEADYQRWLKLPNFNPALWQVAWEGDEVAGMVLNFVNANENLEYARKRGHTEDIGVRKPWRGRGLARALLIRSLHMFQDMGFDSTTLDVDAENPTGALRLYESVGYLTQRTMIAYRKPL